MAKFNHNKIFRGTFGKVWVDGDQMANLKKFEAKAAIDFEDVDINGELNKRKRYMGYNISGTMTLHKFDSYILRKYQAAVMSGDLPDITIVASITDPQNGGTERVQLTGVQFTEITLANFENKGMVEEEVPFTADAYSFLDLI